MRLRDVLPDADQRAVILSSIKTIVDREVDAVFTVPLTDPQRIVCARFRAEGARAVYEGMVQAFEEGLEQRKKARLTK